MDPLILRHLLASGEYAEAPTLSALYVALWGYTVPSDPAVIVARASHGQLSRGVGRNRANIGRDLRALAARGWIVVRPGPRRTHEYILATRTEGGFRRGAGTQPEGPCPFCQGHPRMPSPMPSPMPSRLPSPPDARTSQVVENSGGILPSRLPSSTPSPMPSSGPSVTPPAPPAAALPLSPRASAHTHERAIGAPKGHPREEGNQERTQTGEADASPGPLRGGDSLTFVSPTRAHARDSSKPAFGRFGGARGEVGEGTAKSRNPFADDSEAPEAPSPKPPTPPRGAAPLPRGPAKAPFGARSAPQATNPLPLPARALPGAATGPQSAALRPGVAAPSRPTVPQGDFAARVEPLWWRLFDAALPGVGKEVWGPRERRILNDLASRYGEADARLMVYLFLRAWKSRWAKEWFWNKEPAPTVGLLFLKHGSLAPFVTETREAYELDSQVMPYFRKHRRHESLARAQRFADTSRLIADLGHTDPTTGSLKPLSPELGG